MTAAAWDSLKGSSGFASASGGMRLVSWHGGAVHALAVSLDLSAPLLAVAPPPAVAGPCTHAGVLGMYATSSGCCIILHRPPEGMEL